MTDNHHLVKHVHPQTGEPWINIARRNGINRKTFYSRTNRGWEPAKAATHELRANFRIDRL